MSELVLYTSNDGRTRLDLRVEGQTVWLTQLEIAELFQTTKHNISIHTKNIFQDGELTREATVKESLTVQTEGKREVQRAIQLYNLDLILAIGYRVRSPRGVQFRQWASSHLKEYLVKGFVMDDERLKNPCCWDYYAELPDHIAAKPGFFLAQVIGESMNKRIPNGSWCLFREPTPGSREGKIVLVQSRDIQDPDSGGQYTVKTYRSEKNISEDTWTHTHIRLEPNSSDLAFQPILLEANSATDLQVIGEFVGMI